MNQGRFVGPGSVSSVGQFELQVHQGEGWKRFALLPSTLSSLLLSIIAEEAYLAWCAPVRVMDGHVETLRLGGVQSERS
jgi:hypothetical protein